MNFCEIDMIKEIKIDYNAKIKSNSCELFRLKKKVNKFAFNIGLFINF